MAYIQTHPDNTPTMRFSVNIRHETKKLLDEYAHENRMSLSLAVDRLLKEGAENRAKSPIPTQIFQK